jgi:hypothetical protein
MPAVQLMPAYNQTARINVRGCWDLYVTGSFIYWMPMQDNIDLAISTTAAASTTTGFDGEVVNADYNYKPGFQVCAGVNFDHDEWDGFAQYTWLHGQNSTSVSSASGFITPIQEVPSFSITDDLSYSETWKFKFDFVDVDLGRKFYVGKSLLFRPAMGARGAWIRQKLDIDSNNETPRTEDFDQSSVSWGVGFRTGIMTDWMLGCGFRMFGSSYADILYTRYNLKQSDVVSANISTVNVKQHHADYLRPHMDLEFGFGWDSYFDCSNWHVDLMASYGFQVFFNQNMFRHFTDDIALGTSTLPNGDLYIHGLTVTARFDF